MVVLAASQPDVIFQPIVDLASGDPLGYEALARFAGDPYRPPNVWMTEAAAVGLGVELELQAIANALAVADGLPAECDLSLNASPSAVLTGRLVGVLARCERPIAVEVTGTRRPEASIWARRSTSCAPPGPHPRRRRRPATPG